MGGVGNFGQDGNKLRKLGENHPLLAESAVIPPVTELRCIPHRPGKRLGSRLQNPAGVTVGQIFKYFVSYFKPQVSCNGTWNEQDLDLNLIDDT
jgi:hypothetical protein